MATGCGSARAASSSTPSEGALRPRCRPMAACSRDDRLGAYPALATSEVIVRWSSSPTVIVYLMPKGTSLSKVDTEQSKSDCTLTVRCASPVA